MNIGVLGGMIVCAAVAVVARAQTVSRTVPMNDAHVRIVGRYEARPDGVVRLGYPGSGFLVRFRGGSLGLTVTSSSNTSALTVVADHGEPRLVLLRKGEQTIALAEGAEAGPHLVEVYKRTETWQGLVDLVSVSAGPGDELLSPPLLPVRKLLFIGDSVTCGAGVDSNAQCTEEPAHPNGDPYHSYGMVLGRRLDAQVDLVCYGGRGLERDYRGLTMKDGVLNAPDFVDLAIATDEPSTRAVWNAQRWSPEGIVVSLGTNDFNLQKTKPLHGPAFVADYVALLKRLRAEYPHATVFVTEGAIVTDPLLRQYVREAVAGMNDVHVQWAAATHYPGNGCNAHPTREQHGRMADDLEPLLRRGLHW